MDKHGHAAKGSNALVASIDFYSTALADALAENAHLQAQLAVVGKEMHRDSDMVKLVAPVMRSAALWAKSYGSREIPGPSMEEYDRLCVRLCNDVVKFVRMDDRSSMEAGDEVEK